MPIDYSKWDKLALSLSDDDDDDDYARRSMEFERPATCSCCACLLTDENYTPNASSDGMLLGGQDQDQGLSQQERRQFDALMKEEAARCAERIDLEAKQRQQQKKPPVQDAPKTSSPKRAQAKSPAPSNSTQSDAARKLFPSAASRPSTVPNSGIFSSGKPNVPNSGISSSGKPNVPNTGKSSSGKPTATRKPNSSPSKFKLFIHPEDNSNRLHPVYLSDPDKFKPQINPETNRFDRWGIDIDMDQVDQIQTMMAGNLYLPFRNPTDTRYHKRPEVQFIEKLMERKMDQISQQPTLRNDMIIKVTLTDTNVVRRLKVSASTKLDTFHDKILGPAMGWARHYHGYLFTDFKDGAQFGPKGSDAIDMMHMPLNGFTFIDAKSVRLGDILRTVGTEIGYEYDLGDHFEHDILLEKIIPEEESNGALQLIDGFGLCPPEDSRGYKGEFGVGSYGYSRILKAWPTLSSSTKRNVINLANGAFNYKGTSCSWDPSKTFNLEEARKRLEIAVRSKASTLQGSKSVQYRLRPGADFDVVNEGEMRVMREDLRTGPGDVKETISTRKDRKSQTLCVNCGSPNNLKKCQGCQLVYYCGRDCQREDWHLRHREECKKISEKK